MKKTTLSTLLLPLCLFIFSSAFGQEGLDKKDTSGSEPAASSEKKEGLTLKQKDSMAKSLGPAEGKAIVYILRPSGAAFLIKMNLNCDSVHIGATKAGNYVYTLLPPGPHTFESISENHSTFNLVLEAGKMYYIRQEVKMGFAIAETGLKQEDEKQGLKDLHKCKLAKDNVYSE